MFDLVFFGRFFNAVFRKAYFEEMLVLWEVNKGFGKRRLYELVFWEILCCLEK